MAGKENNKFLFSQEIPNRDKWLFMARRENDGGGGGGVCARNAFFTLYLRRTVKWNWKYDLWKFMGNWEQQQRGRAASVASTADEILTKLNWICQVECVMMMIVRSLIGRTWFEMFQLDAEGMSYTKHLLLTCGCLQCCRFQMCNGSRINYDLCLLEKFVVPRSLAIENKERENCRRWHQLHSLKTEGWRMCHFLLPSPPSATAQMIPTHVHLCSYYL